jgi:4'-phosphopantetheinyl transferase
MNRPTNFLLQLNYASLKLLSNKNFFLKILNWLSPEELKRYKKFSSRQQASQFLLARALLRSQLSNRVPSVLPYEWIFVVDKYGKPRLADGFSHLNLHFNLSHSEDLVVLALGEGLDKGLSIGVDVEYIQRPVFSMALAKRYFAKTELTDLMALTEQQQIKRIAQLWTLKESYLKTNSLGVRVPLKKIRFNYHGESGLSLSISPSWINILPVEGRSFIGLFDVFCLGLEYSLALTVEADKKIDTSVMAISEWVGLNSQLQGLKCELLRKTAG